MGMRWISRQGDAAGRRSTRGKTTNRTDGYQGRSEARGEDCNLGSLLWRWMGSRCLETGRWGRDVCQRAHRHGGGTRCAEVEIRFKLPLSSELRFWRKVRTPGARALHFGSGTGRRFGRESHPAGSNGAMDIHPLLGWVIHPPSSTLTSIASRCPPFSGAHTRPTHIRSVFLSRIINRQTDQQ